MEYLQYTVYKYAEAIDLLRVLNLIINGIPSIRREYVDKSIGSSVVLNLIINGIPSIPYSIGI